MSFHVKYRHKVCWSSRAHGPEIRFSRGALQLVWTRVMPDAMLHASDNVNLHLAELDTRSHVGKPPPSAMFRLSPPLALRRCLFCLPPA
jgi:hypothetical protein